MSAPRHTPGPWLHGPLGAGTIIVGALNGGPSKAVAVAYGESSNPASAANVNLICAAPELAAALLEMLERGEGCAACGDGRKVGCGCRYERARASLRKAGVLP